MKLRRVNGKAGFDRPPRSGEVPRRAVDRALWEKQVLGRMQRAARHLNFKEIGELTGVHPETVRRYMTHGRPTAFFVATIGKALGVSLDWLMFGTAHNEGRQAADDNGQPSDQLNLPDDTQAEVVSGEREARRSLPEVFTVPNRVRKVASPSFGASRSR